MTAFLHKLKNDRRGVALEMAITLLVVTFALSTLVLTTSLLQHSKKVQADNQLPRTVALEQISEAFCVATASGDRTHDWAAAYPDYLMDISDNGLTLTVSDKNSGTVLLILELEQNDGKYTVVQWNRK